MRGLDILALIFAAGLSVLGLFRTSVSSVSSPVDRRPKTNYVVRRREQQVAPDPSGDLSTNNTKIGLHHLPHEPVKQSNRTVASSAVEAVKVGEQKQRSDQLHPYSINNTGIHNTSQQPSPRDPEGSLLVLMNVKIKSELQMGEELRWIREDNSAVCAFYANCKWAVNAVVTKDALLKPFEVASSALPSNIMFHVTVSSSYFNKFAFIKRYLDDLMNYDHILFKDNDQRIKDFPWHTFVEKSSTAIMAGPMRRTVKSSCGSSPQMQISEVCHYEKDDRPHWSSIMYTNVVPLEVPLLEMFFVLMDAKFANFFFSLLLRDNLTNNASSWGPDLTWCQAAKVWADNGPGCFMVPVVSKHENTMQIIKSGAQNEGGDRAIKALRADAILGKWTTASSTWHGIVVGGRNLAMIEQSCRRLLRSGESDAFDIEHIHQCSAKSVRPIPGIHHTLRQLVRKMESENSVEDTMLLNTARIRLEERIREAGIQEKSTNDPDQSSLMKSLVRQNGNKTSDGGATSSKFDDLCAAAYDRSVGRGNGARVDNKKSRRVYNIDEFPTRYRTGGGLDDADRHLLGKIYSAANSAFEYGLGESTYIAAWTNMPRWSGVDSDSNWVVGVRDKEIIPPHFQFSFGDIGPTQLFGFPADADVASYSPSSLDGSNAYNKMLFRYVVAPLALEMDAFDVYLVDGRWRVACACISFLHALKTGGDMEKVRVLVHDYLPERGYPIIEEEIADVVERSDHCLAVLRLKKGVTEKDIEDLYRRHVDIVD